ncbi:hypothetical protein PILCRDRAFT_561571 [Piloderma croceum F 1598]|uniref:Uncharacterized protein n=1 Tax=Piloderma croceum (strain F 1598) TaxID=765440 RepID=A0A0C3FHK2_PILCF|nr:hypothetical protein PILCRDRAFT_561571 [Piloderma croceum F 1598]
MISLYMHLSQRCLLMLAHWEMAAEVSVYISECQPKVRTFIFSFRHELHAIADLVLLAEREALVFPESIESTISTEFVAPRPQNIPYISATVNRSGKTHQSLACCAPILDWTLRTSQANEEPYQRVDRTTSVPRIPNFSATGPS